MESLQNLTKVGVLAYQNVFPETKIILHMNLVPCGLHTNLVHTKLYSMVPILKMNYTSTAICIVCILTAVFPTTHHPPDMHQYNFISLTFRNEKIGIGTSYV